MLTLLALEGIKMLDTSVQSVGFNGLNINSKENALTALPSLTLSGTTFEFISPSKYESSLPSSHVSHERLVAIIKTVASDGLDFVSHGQVKHFPGDSDLSVKSTFGDSDPTFGCGVLTSNDTRASGLDDLITGGKEQTNKAPNIKESEATYSNQPLIGIVDTGFISNNPDVDPSRVHLGRDRIDGDDNPLLADDANKHGTQILNIIAATKNNGIGIDGINDQAPVWLSRAVGSGKWAESLVEFVDAAKASGQPHAIVNLSFDLVQVNADGSVTTRYELTADELNSIKYAHQNGVLIIASAGNQGAAMSALGQAAQLFDSIITVGSADSLVRAEYSSYGNGLTLVADDEGMGTSVAAAKVTGSASQVWAANPDLNYRQVIDILKSTATDVMTPGWDIETGDGVLNLANAVNKATLTTPEHFSISDTVTPLISPSSTSDNTAFERPDAWWDPRDWNWGKLWSGIKSGATWLYNKGDQVLIGSFERTLNYAKKLPSEFKQLRSDYADLLKAVGNGDWENAAKAAGRVLVDYVDLSGTSTAIDQLYELMKPNTRALTSEEIETARSVFGDSINYNLVRVDEWSLLVLGRRLVTGGDDAPFTLFNTINSVGNIGKEILIHELTHVWQYQHIGSIYAAEALGAQITEGRDGAYDYKGVPGLLEKMANGQGITSFNAEQQAEIVEDYYYTKTNRDGSGNLYQDDDIYLSLYAHFVKEVSTLPENQLSMLPTDSGDTLGTARNLDLSILNGAVTLREFIGGPQFSFNGSDGWFPSISSDETDVYRLNVTSGNLNLTLTEMTDDADLLVIQDANGNGVVDSGEVIGISSFGASQDEAINLTGLTPGDYFVSVDRYSGLTGYTLGIAT
jgi:Subtilase family